MSDTGEKTTEIVQINRELTVDRGARGRFLPGNRSGKGNPLAGRAAKIRAVLLQKLTPAKAAKIADVLINNATAGDMSAIREILDRTIGKAVATELLERIERIENHMGGRQ